jgi:hypothetical protein
MKSSFIQSRISPENIACKIALLDNFHTPDFAAQVERFPRMIEVLWFIQWQSIQPGGLVKFAQDFVEAFPSRIGTPAMRRIGQKTLSNADRVAIIDEIPRYQSEAGTPSGRAAADFFNAIEETDYSAFETHRDEEAFKKLDWAGFRTLCVESALEDLPWRLAWFCGLPDEPEKIVRRHWRDDADRAMEGEDRCLEDVWYFADLPGAMLEMLDLHAARVGQHLAKTETAERVFEALQFALEEQCAVSIEGDTRFGKTESVGKWAEMRPGVARVIRTPCSNVKYDLWKNTAEALGFEVPLGMPKRELQRKIEFVLRHGRLFLIFDEAHYLFPRLVSRNTTPARLDWIREQIMDHHSPLALVSTPQEFAHSMKRFVKTTNHNIDQFLKRLSHTVTLSPKFNEADLMNVARLRFPDLPESYLQLIVAKALQTEDFYVTVERIAKWARFSARQNGHARTTLEDLDKAIEKVIGTAAPVPFTMAERTRRLAAPPVVMSSSVKPALRGPSRPTSPPPAPEAPARETSPVLEMT